MKRFRTGSKDKSAIDIEYSKAKIKTLDEYITKLKSNSLDTDVQTIKQNSNVEELNQAKTQPNNILIKIVSFSTLESNPEFKKLSSQKTKQQLFPTKVQLSKASTKVETELTVDSIETFMAGGMSQKEKDQLLQKAKEDKKAKEQADFEIAIAPEIQKMKVEGAAKADAKRKQKKIEVESRINAGQKDSITNEEIYELGKYSLDLGHVNGIESLWSFTKRRLVKFNGYMNNLNLHLKECEWRWNHSPPERSQSRQQQKQYLFDLEQDLWKILNTYLRLKRKLNF